MTLKVSSVFHQFWQSKVFRFLICGVITAVFNVLLLIAIIQAFEIKTPFFRNFANVLSIEVSLIFSFFVYRAWVWSTRRSSIREIMFQQMPLYHLSVATSIASRSFVVFPILDWLGVHYVINTLIGIVLGSIVNYRISDKLVFKVKS